MLIILNESYLYKISLKTPFLLLHAKKKKIYIYIHVYIYTVLVNRHFTPYLYSMDSEKKMT